RSALSLSLRDSPEGTFGPLSGAVLVAGALAAVDVEDFAGHEARRLEVENRFDNVGDLAHMADRLKSPEGLMGLDRVNRRLHEARRDGVHANTALGVFDGERLGRRVEAALRQRRKHGGYAGDGAVDQARRDLDDMAAALLLHLGDGELRGME